MLLHMPIVVALAAAAFFLKRKGSLKATHALATAAFGFYLADTSLATSIQAASADLLSMIGTFGT